MGMSNYAITGLLGGLTSQSYLLGITKENEEYWKLFNTGKFTSEDYKVDGESFKYLTSFYQSLLKDAPGLFDDIDGNIRIPKWAVKAVADAFETYNQQKNIEHNLDMTLEEAFRVPSESKQETIKKLQSKNKDKFFFRVNCIRMYFFLNVSDSVTAAWKIVQWQKDNKPGFFYNFKASQKSMLDAYHRAYPQPFFMEWMMEWGRDLTESKVSGETFRESYMKWIEKNVPEAATFIKRKMRPKKG